MKISPHAIFITVCLILAGYVVLYLACPLSNPEDHHERAPCANNLSVLYRGLLVYVAKFGNNLHYPPHRGEMVWLCLVGQCGDTKKHPPDYFQKAPLCGSNILLVCPDSNIHSRPTDYLGPKPFIVTGRSDGTPPDSALSDECPPDYPIAADKPANHRGAGGNVLRFDGSVSFRTDADYEKALKTLE